MRRISTSTQRLWPRAGSHKSYRLILVADIIHSPRFRSAEGRKSGACVLWVIGTSVRLGGRSVGGSARRRQDHLAGGVFYGRPTFRRASQQMCSSRALGTKWRKPHYKFNQERGCSCPNVDLILIRCQEIFPSIPPAPLPTSIPPCSLPSPGMSAHYCPICLKQGYLAQGLKVFLDLEPLLLIIFWHNLTPTINR
jgi:hypothetical protein